MNIAEKCGKRIQQLRLEFKLSQEEFAQKVEISRNALSNYERGLRSPDISTLQAISAEFNIPIDYIIGTSDVKSHDENIKMICEVTGLSEYSIETLQYMKNKPYFEILNKILGCTDEDDFSTLEEILTKTLERCEEIIKMKSLSQAINNLANTKLFYDINEDNNNTFIKKILIDIQKEILKSCKNVEERENINKYFNLTFDTHMIGYEKFCLQTDIMELINNIILDYTNDDEKNKTIEQFYLFILNKYPKIMKKYIPLLQKEQQLSNARFDSLMNTLGFDKNL